MAHLRRAVPAAVAAALGAFLLPVAGASAARPTADASAVIAWNATTTDALVIDALFSPTLVDIGAAYVQAAVYNAVVGIEGGYTPYKWDARGPHGASTGAAVAAAARGVLLSYFPVSEPRVDTAYAAALASIPDGWRKDAGVRFGELAAAHLIAQRADDGWLAPVPFTLPPDPGVWRPTPPGEAPFTSAFVGVMTPFLLGSADQFRPAGPPALTSSRYTVDFDEVRALGSATSATRTQAQTETALFFADNAGRQLQDAFRDHVTRHHLDAVEAARYFAVGDLAAADALITSWDSKLHFGSWRPITAIELADTDGNPATAADPAWSPLIPTPPFPDYLSGHTTVFGAVTRALTRLYGTSRIDLNIESRVTGTTRHYGWAGGLNADSIGSRIWGGIHFRTADEVGNEVGKHVGSWAARRYFAPLQD